MKQIEKYLIYVLLLGVVGLYILHFNGEATEVSDEIVADTLQESTSNPKVGLIYYVNTDSVWENFAMVEEVYKKLEAKQKQYEGQMESKLRDFEREVMEFRQNGANMSEVELQIRQRDLVNKESQLAELKNSLETKFMEEEKEWNDKLRKKIVNYIDEKTKDLRYDYILGYSITSNIILANDSLELTSEVIEGLNEQYQLEQNSK